jgi:PhnB protein
MPTMMNPYLNFYGNARQAMEFYRSVFGGALSLQTYKDFHIPTGPGDEDKIMHAMLSASIGFVLMGADTLEPLSGQSTTISLTLSGEDHAELESYYKQLSAGGTVVEPLAKAPWGDTFGMCIDPFGVQWMVDITEPQS